MAIAGVVIKATPEKEQEVANQLTAWQGIEIHQITKGNIVAVLEGPDLQWLNWISTQITNIPDVLVVLPAYINQEDLQSREENQGSAV